VHNADPRGVLTGTHFIDGDVAAGEGGLAAGCRVVAGYPITPSTEVVERMAQRFPEVGGVFIQMEDEIASSLAIQGAVWGGAKSMTVTSGPGFSLMMEHIGYAIMTETPCVFVNVQRGGPSTGLPTHPGQQDMMQCRWGSHGDYEVIALSPNSPQECFDLMIEAFNLSEEYRTPVFLMMDECVGHMTEKVVIPPADKIKLRERQWTNAQPGKYLPYATKSADSVPDMARVGDGHFFHITGLTHDERGYPAMTHEAQEKLLFRLRDKILNNRHKIMRWEEDHTDAADVLVISYGITSRVTQHAVNLARAQGAKVGHMRLITCWPFPGERIAELAKTAKAIVFPEINLGQMVLEAERAVKGSCKVIRCSHAGGGVHDPEQICRTILEAR
jgi:2-oxoglutarate ferredoxin oxidoreductase subunit alpha